MNRSVYGVPDLTRCVIVRSSSASDRFRRTTFVLCRGTNSDECCKTRKDPKARLAAASI